MRQSLQAVNDRMTNMENRYPNPFPFNRNGLRLAIAAIEDETGELYDEWKLHKRTLGNARERIQHELLDIAGCALLAYERTFDNGSRNGHSTEANQGKTEPA